MIRNIAIVSLSSGIIGEPGVHFEIEIGLQRLKEYGLNVKFMPHALKGLEYVKAHPEKRARDLLEAFCDPEVDMILCACTSQQKLDTKIEKIENRNEGLD